MTLSTSKLENIVAGERAHRKEKAELNGRQQQGLPHPRGGTLRQREYPHKEQTLLSISNGLQVQKRLRSPSTLTAFLIPERVLSLSRLLADAGVHRKGQEQRHRPCSVSHHLPCR